MFASLLTESWAIPSGKPLALAEILSALLVLSVVGNIVYNLYFHPLAGFPGPKIAGFSRLWYIRSLLSGRLPFDTSDLHKEYGSTVRIAPNELSFNDAPGWPDVYGNRIGRPELPKDPLFYATTSSGSVGLFGSTRERHGPLRRLVSHGFSEKALREQEPIIQEYADLLMSRVYRSGESGQQYVDMVKWYNFFTFDVIGHLAFGESFECLATAEYHPWVAAIFDNVKYNSFLRAVGYYPLLQGLLTRLLPSSLKERRQEHHRMTLAKVQTRKELKTNRADFLARFLEEGADVSAEELVATSRTLIIAGSETTATLLSGVTFLLIKNPSALKKVVEEVKSAFDSEDDITLIGVNNLKYMLACLDEALRVYPPVPGSFPRRTINGRVEVLNGKEVPGDTVVAVAQFATYHSPENFHLPDEYIPERWLGDPRFANDNRAAFQPFAVGPRNCVGRNLAYVEMRLVLTRLLWNFELVDLDPSSTNWADQNVYLLWEKPELWMRLKPVSKDRPRWLKD